MDIQKLAILKNDAAATKDNIHKWLKNQKFNLNSKQEIEFKILLDKCVNSHEEVVLALFEKLKNR